jgi:outer membrane PBP1 activator LpoA protein
VYATGRIYSGQPDPPGNQDLDGVRFPLTPWELQHNSADAIPDLASLRRGASGSLFALGQDAWSMLTWLDLMRKDPDFIFHGQSGHYRMDRTGRLVRQPAWGEFRLGRPVPLEPGPEPEPSPQPTLPPVAVPGPAGTAPAEQAAPPGR